MPYNKSATKTVLDLIGLTPGSQQIADLWLSLWDGCHLPSQDGFHASRLGALDACTMIHKVRPDESVRISRCGSQLARWMGEGLRDEDWIDLALPKFRNERLRRFSAVARGAIMRTTRHMPSEENGFFVIETISLPLQPNSDGSVAIAHFFTGLPEEAADGLLREVGIEPDSAEFVPIIINDLQSAPEEIVCKALQPEERVKIISRAALRFLLAVCADALAAYPNIELDPIDLLLANLIGSANISHIENDPELRKQYAGLIEPDWIRRGISRAGVSRAMALPLETIRRRINKMVQLGVLIERPDGVILSANNPYKLDSNIARMHVHAQLTERFWRELKTRGVQLG